MTKHLDFYVDLYDWAFGLHIWYTPDMFLMVHFGPFVLEVINGDQND